MSRSKLKDYKFDTSRLITLYERRPGKQLTLRKIQSDKGDTGNITTPYLVDVRKLF